MYLLPGLAGLASVGMLFAFRPNLLLVVIVSAMTVLMLASSLMLWWTGRRSQGKRRNWERDRYLDHLERQRAELAALSSRQAGMLREQHPDPDQLLHLVENHARVWERQRHDADFLRLGLGLGRVPLCCELKLGVSDSPFVEYPSDLLDRARRLIAQFSEVEGVPVTFDLATLGTVALMGDLAQSRSLVRALLCEAATLHGPDDLQVAVATDADAVEAWEWAKWLPHCRRNRALGPIAFDSSGLDALYSQLVAPRLRAASPNAAFAMPQLILIVDGKAAAAHLERQPDFALINRAAASGLTMIWLPGSGRGGAIDARIHVPASGLLSFEEIAMAGRRVDSLRSTQCNMQLAESIARGLAPLRLDAKDGAKDLSETVRLTQLLGLASASRLEPSTAWAGDPAFGMLRMPIGDRIDGHPVFLDLKEAAEGGMGPHGLIVGATGSGKSELLRTIVSALAATHDPDLLNFVFVDFKGGASFADLARLPHCAGMITNLEQDLTLVDRMQAALFGEQERRQRMLREAGNVDNIRQYRKRGEIDPDLPAMPHLLVIVDEFGELLTNRPDFLELFVTLGRVGRSIGMHLMLATQRLDEGRIRGLEGHLRYRLCLRTFSPEESAAVLGSQDAFHLPPYPGVGYLKVDSGMQLFKVALVSIPHEDSAGGRNPIHRFTESGGLEPVLETLDFAGEHEEARSDMDVIIEQLAGGRPPVHQVWLPPLPSRITLGELDSGRLEERLRERKWPQDRALGALRVAVGSLDLPRAQRQEPLLLDFSGIGGHLALVGAPQSGKSTFLRTLVAAFVLSHDPAEVQFYLVDLGGGGLRSLEAAPHVGVIAGKAERERVLQTIQHVAAVIDEREVFFREHRIDGMAAYRRLRGAGSLEAIYGDVFLVVDDIAQLQSDVEQAEAELVRIATTGLSYGVHLVVTASRWADIRPKLRDAMGNRLELRLNDPADSELGRAFAKTLPAGIPGRGLTREGLQFQVALPQVWRLETDGIATWAAESWSAAGAPRVLALPQLVTPAELAGAGPGIPIGIEQSGLQTLSVDLEHGEPHFLTLGDGESGKTNLLRLMISGVAVRRSPQQASIVIADFRRTLGDVAGLPQVAVYATTPEKLVEACTRLQRELESREPAGLTSDWSGQHVYLFVDDYDWIASPMGNPLAGLADLVLRGRDIGFHVVLARRVGGTARTAFEPFFQRLREMSTPGLIFSGDPQEGTLLGAQRAAALPSGRAFFVRRGQKTALVQIAFVQVRPGIVREERKGSA
jgi:DNA segregation ATPase FtsK/SpoIIIE, S-DNA-T family